MHNSFETLQKKCKRYHFKKVSKKTILPLFTIMILALGSYLLLQPQDQVTIKPQQTSPTVKMNTEKNLVQPTVPAKEIEPVIVAQPITNTPKVKDVAYNLHVDDSYVPKHKVANVKQKKSPKPKTKAKKEIAKEVTKEKKQVVINDPVPQATPLSMSTKKIKSTDELISLFQNEQKYALALQISQEFYDLKQYSRASLWAKKANVLDREADGAWIMYAKSEYAKGQKKRAIEILKLYLANANSTEGEALILSWTQGK
ncbi:MAG: hypothetical protein U9P71_05485 [Campylobacterota bacterium]|nr:hypothetical protein [Campylobacterota bacterium]